jgi:hypothetical protein
MIGSTPSSSLDAQALKMLAVHQNARRMSCYLREPAPYYPMTSRILNINSKLAIIQKQLCEARISSTEVITSYGKPTTFPSDSNQIQ